MEKRKKLFIWFSIVKQCKNWLYYDLIGCLKKVLR